MIACLSLQQDKASLQTIDIHTGSSTTTRPDSHAGYSQVSEQTTRNKLGSGGLYTPAWICLGI